MLHKELDSSSSEGFVSNNEDGNIHVGKTVKLSCFTICSSHSVFVISCSLYSGVEL